MKSKERAGEPCARGKIDAHGAAHCSGVKIVPNRASHGVTESGTSTPDPPSAPGNADPNARNAARIPRASKRSS
jgi:hypothetical protein